MELVQHPAFIVLFMGVPAGVLLGQVLSCKTKWVLITLYFKALHSH